MRKNVSFLQKTGLGLFFLTILCAFLGAQDQSEVSKATTLIIQGMDRPILETKVSRAPFARWHPGFSLLTLTNDSDCPFLFLNDLPFTMREIKADYSAFINTTRIGSTMGFGLQVEYLIVEYGMVPFFTDQVEASKKSALLYSLLSDPAFVQSKAVSALNKAVDNKRLREKQLSKEIMMGLSGGLGWGLGGISLACFAGWAALPSRHSSRDLVFGAAVGTGIGAVASVAILNLVNDAMNKGLSREYQKIAESMDASRQR